MDETFTIELTIPELVYIGSALNLPGLSIDDDWVLEDETEFESLLLSAQNTLDAKGYIRLPSEDDAPLALDQTVATMVSVLGYPQYGLDARCFREKRVEPEQMRLFGAGELIVEEGRDADETHTLTACRTRVVALERLVAFLGLAKQPPAHTESFRVAAADMAEVPYIIAGNGPENGAAFLRDKGVPPKAAARLAAALDNPVRQSAVRAYLWEDGEPREVGRLTLLEEVYGLWLIAPAEDDEDALTIAPVSAAGAVDRLRDLAFGVLPPEST